MLAWFSRWRPRMQRIRRASWADRRLLTEAVLCLGLARFSVCVVPSRWLLHRLGRQRYETRPDEDIRSTDAARRVGAAISGVSPYTPWRSNCLAQALAAHVLLRRRSISSTLYLCVTRERGRLEAHAVLRSGPYLITGGDDHERYTRVASFGWTP
ncbi:MAG: lasso peptide biosynthesis B2 protein [Acidobacteriota bacterium]